MKILKNALLLCIALASTSLLAIIDMGHSVTITDPSFMQYNIVASYSESSAQCNVRQAVGTPCTLLTQAGYPDQFQFPAFTSTEPTSTGDKVTIGYMTTHGPKTYVQISNTQYNAALQSFNQP